MTVPGRFFPPVRPSPSSARFRPQPRSWSWPQPRPQRRSRSRSRRDQGSAALEFLGVLPILLLVALAGIQLGLVAYTASQAGTAARAAARAEAKFESGTSGEAAGRAAVSDWLGAPRITISETNDAVTATAEIEIPPVVPGWNPDSVHRSATMPREDNEKEVGP